MLCCRVCRTENNLKYTKQELRKQRTGKRRQQLIKNAAQLGNICFDCDLRLQTYHQAQDSDSDELDVDGSLPTMPKLPTNVADDVLMYQQFVANVKKSQKFINDLNVVEVVDLSVDSDTEHEKENLKLLQNCTPHLVTHPHETQPPEKKRRKRKRYDENEFRLLASFSLVSSDSEAEDSKQDITKVSTPKETAKVSATKGNNFNNNNNNVNQNLSFELSDFKCDKCSFVFQDFESLCIHRQIHAVPKLNCPACEHVCVTPKRLINHMRCKHRTYQSPLLTERPRCSQDSAMTIRLRYREHDIYYECQLCGRIDDVFKQHKEHILKEHADESKQLGDPISPSLSRSKEKAKPKSASTELCPVCKHDCGQDKLELAKHMAATHRLEEYKSHLRQIFKVEKYKSQIVQIRKTKKTARLFKVVRTQCLLFQCRQCDESVQLNCQDHLNHVKTHQTGKVKSRNLQQLEKQNQIRSQRETKEPTNITKVGKTSKALVADDTKELKKQRKALLKEEKEKLKKKSIKAAAAAIVKVKVKAPPRSIPLQKCVCEYCNETCDSFLCLNRHLLKEHRNEEYCTCAECGKSYNSKERLKNHECEPMTHQRKRKRTM